jgi:hypothetical protein
MTSILFVEGDSDRDFFTKFLQSFVQGLKVDIVAPIDTKNIDPPNPKHSNRNGANNAIIRFCDVAKNARNSHSRLGLILDADADGVEKRIQDVQDEIKLKPNHGYSDFLKIPGCSGFRANHTDNLPALGLWVMPNNKETGIFEKWIYDILHPDHEELFQHAKNAVKTLPLPRLFDDDYSPKAELYTWLAWQKKPSLRLENIDKPHLNHSCAHFQDFALWMATIFGEHPAEG